MSQQINSFLYSDPSVTASVIINSSTQEQLMLPVVRRNDTDAIVASGSTVNVDQGVMIVFSHSEPDVTFRFTLTTNGVEPTEASLSGFDVTMDVNAVLKVKAFKPGYLASDTVTIVFNVTPVFVATPVIMPESGTYIDSANVAITCDTPDAIIRYTTNGAQPSLSSPLYAGTPIVITQSCTVRAMAYKPFMTTSYAEARHYTIEAAIALALEFTTTIPVIQNIRTIAATIRTFDNNTGNTNINAADEYFFSLVPVGQEDNFLASSQTTWQLNDPDPSVPAGALEREYVLKARVQRNELVVTTEGHYIIIDEKAPVTTANLPGGTYQGDSISVELSVADLPVAIIPPHQPLIYYTLDNSVPNASSAQYTMPINIPSPGDGNIVTLKFISIDAAGNAEAPNWAMGENTHSYLFDNSAPVVTILNLSKTILRVGDGSTITWKVNEDCKKWRLEVGGTGLLGSGTLIAEEYVNIVADVEHSVTVASSQIPGGTSTLYLYCTDESDIVGNASFTLMLDNQIPVITVYEVCRHTLATHDTAVIVWSSSVSGSYEIRRDGINPGQGFLVATGTVAAKQIMETAVSNEQLIHNLINNVRIYVTTPGGMVGAASEFMTVDSLPPTTTINPPASDGPFNTPLVVTITAHDVQVPSVVVDATSRLYNDCFAIEDAVIIEPIKPNLMFGANVPSMQLASHTSAIVDNYVYAVSDTANVVLNSLLPVLDAPTITRSDSSLDLQDNTNVNVDQGVMIVFSHPEPDVTFRFTLTTGGVEPTEASLSGVDVTMDVTAILKVKAFKAGYAASSTVTIYFTVTPVFVATPVLVPSGGTFIDSVSVSIACDTPDALIRYTTNGSQPNMSSSLYVGTPLTLTQSCTVRAMAYKPFMTTSYAVPQSYIIEGLALNAPTVRRGDTNDILADGGSVNVDQGVMITFSHTEPDVTFRFTLTTAGVEPTETSLSGFDATLDVNAVLKVKAYKPGYDPSPTVTIAFNVTPVYVATPIITPSAGTYVGATEVSIACDTPDAIIRYTTNGTQPTVTSLLYTAPFMVSQSSTIRAMAYKPFMTTSYAQPQSYTIEAETAHTPIIRRADTNQIIANGSTVVVNQGTLILIGHDDPDAIVRFTLSTAGIEPTEMSLTGFDATLDVNAVFKAKAFKAGANPSATITINFIVIPVYVEQPMFVPAPGMFLDQVAVRIVTATEGAIVKYTLDGSPANQLSPVFSDDSPAIILTATTTINAIASKPFMTTTSNSGLFTIVEGTESVALNVMVNAYRTTCVIRWATNVPCTTRIDYGLTPIYAFSTPESTGYSTSHEIILTGLTPNREYHFSIGGTSIEGIPFRVIDRVFVTQANRDTRLAIYATNDGTTPTTAHFTNRVLGQQLSLNINYNTTLKFFAIDGFGNQQEVQTEVYSLDVQPPVVTVDYLKPAVIGVASTALLRFKANEPITYVVVNQANTILATNGAESLLEPETWVVVELHEGDMIEGYNHITIVATDIYHNKVNVLVGHVIKDTIAPNVIPSKNAGYYNEDVYVSLIPTNLRENEKITIYYTIDGSMPDANSTHSGVGENQIHNILISATTTLRWYAIDDVGNESLRQYATFIIDRQKPSLMASPMPGTYDEILDVQLIANEPATIYYTLDGSTPSLEGGTSTYQYIANRPIEVLQDTVITCFAQDLAGNISNVEAFYYEIKSLKGRKFKKVIGFQDKILLETEFNEAQDNINRRLEELAQDVVGAKCIIYGFDIQKSYAPNVFDFYIQKGKAYIGGKFVALHRNVSCTLPEITQTAVETTWHVILRPHETIFKPSRPGQPGWEEGVPEITTYRLEENYKLEVVGELPRVDDDFIELYTVIRPTTATNIQECVFVDHRAIHQIDDQLEFQNRTKKALETIEANLLALGLEAESYKLRNLLGLKNVFVDTFETLKDIDQTKSQQYRYFATRFEL